MLRPVVLGNESAGTPSNRFRVRLSGPVEIDVLSRSILSNGTRLPLRPLELGLLTFLAEHPNETFSRGELLEHIWGASRRPGPRTVDVHVRWLRQKLATLPRGGSLLVTVRGIGYRWEPSNVNEPITRRERIVDQPAGQ